MKDYFKVTTKTIVATGLGAAIFMLLFILAKLPTVGIYITILLVMFAIGIVTTCIFKRKKDTDISKVK